MIMEKKEKDDGEIVVTLKEDTLDLDPKSKGEDTEAFILPKPSLSYWQAGKLVMVNCTPPLIARFISMLNGPLTVIILSNFDSKLLPVTALVSAVQLTGVTIPGLVLYGTAPLIGIAHGAAKGNESLYRKIGNIMHSSFLMSLFVSASAISLISFSQPILIFLGQDADLSAQAQEYLSAYRWGVPALSALIVAQQLSSGLKKPLVTFCSTVLNLAIASSLGYLLVNGKIIEQINGMSGMGYAHAISNFLSLGGLICYFLAKKEFRKYAVFGWHGCRKIIDEFLKILKIGIPIQLTVGSEIITLTLITILTGAIGEIELSAHQIASQFFALYLGSSLGMSQAVAVLISHEMGADHLKNAATIGKTALGLLVITSLAMASCFTIISRQFPPLLNFIGGSSTSEKVTGLTKKLMLIDGVGQLGDFSRNCLTNILRGYSINWLPMILNVFFMTVMTFGLSHIFDNIDQLNAGSVENIYIGRDVGMYAAAAILFILWNVVVHKTNHQSHYQETQKKSSNQYHWFSFSGSFLNNFTNRGNNRNPTEKKPFLDASEAINDETIKKIYSSKRF